MRVYNCTNLIIEFQDRVILPGRGRDYPDLEEKYMTGIEKRAFEKGVLSKSPVTKLMAVPAPVRPDAPCNLELVLEFA